MTLKLITALFLTIFSFQVFAQSQTLPVDSFDYTWKGLLVAGDNSIANFDRGRLDLAAAFEELGQDPNDQKHYSITKQYLREGTAVLPTLRNLEQGLSDLNINPETDGCLVHMTSHGTRGRGFYLAGIGMLSTRAFNNIINKHCKDAPTVIMISACFSGQFINSELQGPNRIILTAARHDVPSFGCSPDYKYTFWDGCILSELPNSETWKDLYANVTQCIERKESQLGANRSFPQAFFGKNVQDLRILNK
ncbi:MAG: C13 family peptidase [Bacteriovoracaceae bacterium]